MNKRDKIEKLLLEDKSISEIAKTVKAKESYVKQVKTKLEKKPTAELKKEPAKAKKEVKVQTPKEPEKSPLDFLIEECSELRKNALNNGLSRSIWYTSALETALAVCDKNGEFCRGVHNSVILKYNTLRPRPTERNMWKKVFELHNKYLDLYKTV